MSSKSIDTLVDDIYALFEKSEYVPNPDNVNDFGHRLGRHIAQRLSTKSVDDKQLRLRLSNLGTPCSRKLWYTVNTPEDGEPLRPETRIKFLFGDILEELLLFLAKEAGHLVEGQQDEVTVNGVVGHRDAVVDGRIVDVKSASSYSFRKFQENGLYSDDPFGYLSQLFSYLHGSREDDLVKERDVASFLVIDKQLGKITLDTYAAPGIDFDQLAEEKKEMVKRDTPPPRAYLDEPDGKSGNRGLGVQCSYCPFKHKCWPELRTYLYSTGPKYLTVVKNEPRVPEVDKDGNRIEKF